MSESRLMKAWGQGWARSLVIRIIVALCMVGGFLCVTLVTILLPIDQDVKIYLWVGLVIVFTLTVIAGVAIWGIQHIRRRTAELDQAFMPLGLEGRMYLLTGRQYHGHYQGYPLHVYFSRGPNVEIFLDANLETRIGIGRRGAIEKAAANLLDKAPLKLEDPAFDHLVVYPLDRDWSEALLAEPVAREIVLRLTTESSPVDLRSISVTPAAVRFEARYISTSHITPEAVRTWVSDLATLTRLAESLPQPTVQAVESRMESTSRSNRGKFTLPIIAITCGIFTLLSVCILAIVALVIFLEESGL